MTTPTYGETIVFSAVVADGRSVTEVSFELPGWIESPELAAALMAWSLEQHLGPGFEGETPVEWLTDGQQNRDLLPWEQERVAHSLRPHCTVDRDWLRPALKKLRERIPEAEDGPRIHFSFDGEALRIRFQELAVVMAAEGRPWTRRFSIMAQDLLHAPKRLMRKMVTVECWKGHLTIDHRSFAAREEAE